MTARRNVIALLVTIVFSASSTVWVTPIVAQTTSAQTSGAQSTSAYPTKPVRIVVPFPPGGYADVMARTIAADLSVKFAQAVTVDNRPGAGGSIGAEFVARAPADGLTLLMGSIGSNAVNVHLQKKANFDPVKSFEPITFVADADTVLVVPSNSEFRNVQDLIRAAKNSPGKLTYASAGSGSTSHLAGELFKSKAKVFCVHVAYRGNAPALNDLAAGQVNLSFATLQTALPLIQSGKLRALAVLSGQRSALLPQVPTLTEAGLVGVDVRNWIGLFAPLGTHSLIVQRLHTEVLNLMREPVTQERLSKLALTHFDMPPREFATFVKQESERWGVVIKTMGITAD
jgi:tripartite-type tricarboxylate transporter receptor subunit TctC